MRSLTVSDAFAQVAIRSEVEFEEPRPATYREMTAAILLALAESGQEHDPSHECPWDCESELLGEYLDVAAQVPSVTMLKKH